MEVSKKIRRVLIFAILIELFILGSVLGALFAKIDPSTAQNIFYYVMKTLRDYIGNFSEPLSFTIFLNNLRVALISSFGGIFAGLIPAFVLFTNGFILGITAEYYLQQGVTLAKILFAVLPHGIIEIPALALAGTGGVEWFLEVINGKGSMKERITRGFKVFTKFLSVTIFLLLIASLGEVYLTPEIISWI